MPFRLNSSLNLYIWKCSRQGSKRNFGILTSPYCKVSEHFTLGHYKILSAKSLGVISFLFFLKSLKTERQHSKKNKFPLFPSRSVSPSVPFIAVVSLLSLVAVTVKPSAYWCFKGIAE